MKLTSQDKCKVCESRHKNWFGEPMVCRCNCHAFGVRI